MKLDREKIERVFREYVSRYNADDPKIKLKIDHTYRVAALCETIAADIPFGDPDLIWLSGMLHDIGRFEQVRQYGTFSDALSVNHAQFGAELLFQDGLIDTFLPNHEAQMTEKETGILLKSIRYHSSYRLPEDLSEEETKYCDILRDSDKIDILRVNYDTPLEEIYNVSTDVLRKEQVSEAVKECFRNRTAVFQPLKKTAIDHLAAHICLIFELKYPISRRIVREQGYVDRLLEFQSDNPDTQAWFAYMKKDLQTLQ